MNTEVRKSSIPRKKNRVMQAAVITAPGKIEMQTAEIPEPEADEVRIHMEGCGLCASNIPPWQGREWFSYPMEPGSPGHEGWGVVEKTGSQVQHIHPGDRVTALSYHAYAEYDVTKASHVIPLPQSLSGQPFPGEPLGCAMNIFRRSGIQSGMTVAVVGIGFLGAQLVQLAKAAGARVIALSQRKSSLEKAEMFEADEVLQINSHDEIEQKVKVLTDGSLCERVIEATGKQQPLNLAARITGMRGRLVVAGYHQDGLRQVDMQLWNWRGIDVINAHERSPMKYIQGMREAVEAVVGGRLNPFPLFTHTYSICQIQRAFQDQLQKPEGFTKALIKFD
jgi:threonine dehydrogenase-like Zn-dependent dehydrogenase